MASAFPHLLSPVRIGAMTLRNRIAMAPMGVEIIDADGVLRERVIRYFEERAQAPKARAASRRRA